jgi:hypothetical protein
VRITTDFHAAKEISSDLDLSNDDVDILGNWTGRILILCVYFHLTTDWNEL